MLKLEIETYYAPEDSKRRLKIIDHSFKKMLARALTDKSVLPLG